MMELKKNQRYVIFDGPQRHGGPGTRYFCEDGTSTELRSKAVKFFIATDAMDFATREPIPLDGLNSIGIEDFTDFDLRG
ncbi:MAG: hypothetical protein ABIU05_18040 [Nitrospirales bacterium]